MTASHRNHAQVERHSRRHEIFTPQEI